jgi:hypothetical protein
LLIEPAAAYRPATSINALAPTKMPAGFRKYVGADEDARGIQKIDLAVGEQ